MPLRNNPVRDIMIKDVVTIPYNAPVGDAGDLMMKNRVGSLIVMKGKKPIGILTERDFVRLIANDFTRNSGLIVDDIITPSLITVTPSTTFSKAFSVLNTYNIKRLPVVSKGRLLGLITLRHLLIYSRSRLIDMLEQNRNLKKAANKDPLTGVFNKRYLLRRLNEEFNKVKRYGIRLCIIFLDLDFFKKINDTHTHIAGDYVLKTICKILKKNLRSSDFIARFGGEEIMVVAPYAKAFEAAYLANKLRKAVEEYPFTFRRKRMQITISAGVATFSSVKNVRQAIEHADMALYQAKQTGRNKVCRWRDSTGTIVDSPYHHRK